MPSRRRGTTKERGLGSRHRRQAARLRASHIEGSPCWWCGEPMFSHQALSADHSVPRSRGGVLADRLLHAVCNSERGDGARDHLRPAVTGKKLSEHRDIAAIGPRCLRWPDS